MFLHRLWSPLVEEAPIDVIEVCVDVSRESRHLLELEGLAGRCTSLGVVSIGRRSLRTCDGGGPVIFVIYCGGGSVHGGWSHPGGVRRHRTRTVWCRR